MAAALKAKIFVPAALLLGLLAVLAAAEAQSPLPSAEKHKSSALEDIKFPVSELGGCGNEDECLSYCDDADHAKECLAFAEHKGFLSADEAAKMEDLVNIVDGPGGCHSPKSCSAYCSEAGHIDECVAFAEKRGFLSGHELDEAKKVRDVVRQGSGLPGNCRDQSECAAYCNDAAHADECVAFGEKAGFMGPKEAESYRKFLELEKRGKTPGGCSGREACELYCQDPGHMEECLAFGEKAGFLSGQELEMARKMLLLMKEGRTPGGCRSREQCESYCRENQEECFKWAKNQGFVSEEEFSKMREGLKQFKEQLENFPPEVTQCLKDALGQENFKKILEGRLIPDHEFDKKVQSCFDVLNRSHGSETSQGQSLKGPGGCTTPEECMTYCRSHADNADCEKMMPGFGGGMPPGDFPQGFDQSQHQTEHHTEHQTESQSGQ